MINIKDGKKFYSFKNLMYRALFNISFTINEGDYVFIQGNRGAGKTTLMNVIGGIDFLDEGDYIFENLNLKNLHGRKLKRFMNEKFSYVSLNYGFINELNLFENLEIPLIYLKIPKSQREEIIFKNMKFLNLEKLIYSNVKELSLINFQKSCLCRAISKGSRIILFDDLVMDEEILTILDNLNERGFTIIVSGEEIHKKINSNNIIQIKDGRINNINYVHR